MTVGPVLSTGPVVPLYNREERKNHLLLEFGVAYV